MSKLSSPKQIPYHTNPSSLASGTYVTADITSAAGLEARSRRSGFTLVEILVVMVIIAILLGLVLGISHYAQMSALRGKTRSQIEKLNNALMEYNMRYGRYPKDATWFADIKPWLPETFSVANDAWGHAFSYQRKSESIYTLYSWGPDGTNGNGDDISTGR